MFTKASLKDPGSSESSIIKFKEEGQMLCVVIRDSGILLNSLDKFPLKSLSGKVLLPTLVNFYFTTTENKGSGLQNQAFPNSIKRWGGFPPPPTGGGTRNFAGKFFFTGRELHKEYFQSFKAFVMLKLIFHIY